MPKLKPNVQRARSEHILDAAEQCFGRAGFHRTTMHDICKEAGVSPGALYVYFDSKEALIAGISERDRQEFAERFDALAAAPDFLEALRALGEQYFLEEPAHSHRMCIEIGLESTRNPRIGEIFQRIDRYIADSFEKLFAETAGRGPHRPGARYPHHRQGLHGRLRRHVLAARRRPRVQSRRRHAGGAATHRRPAQPGPAPAPGNNNRPRSEGRS